VQEAAAVEEVVDDDGLEDVQLEVALWVLGMVVWRVGEGGWFNGLRDGWMALS